MSTTMIPKVLEDALDRLRKQRLVDSINEAYATLRTNSTEWADLEHEREEWDSTLADGLDEVEMDRANNTTRQS